MRLCLFFFHLLFIFSPLIAADRAEWTQWRGPDRKCGVAAGAEWPGTLDESSLVELYRVPLQPSYSGPIVTKERVFVTETINKEKEVVRALDRDSGKQLWQIEWPGAMSVPFFAASNGSWIRATPIFDGRNLYVPGMLDVLVAIDGANGKEVWRRDFREEFQTVGQSFGFVCSPLIDDGFLYVQTSGGLVKIDCQTGSIAWRSLKEDGGMMGGAFSSPVVATICGTKQLVVQTRSKLSGVGMDAGEELWSMKIESFRDMNILTPTVIGDQIFTSSYGGGAIMLEVTRSDDGFTVRELWKNTTEAYMSSPVVIDGKIYLHLRNKRFSCINSQTGESYWRTTPFGAYWSTVVNGSRLLTLDESGDLRLINANASQYDQISARHVSDSTTWAHLAVADDQVFVRSLDALIVYRWK